MFSFGLDLDNTVKDKNFLINSSKPTFIDLALRRRVLKF